MDKNKFIAKIIGIIITLLIILMILLIILNKEKDKNKNQNTIQNNNTTYSNTLAPRLYTNKNLMELNSSKVLLALQDCINNYYDYIYSKNYKAIVNVLNSDYINSKQINEYNVLNNVENISEKSSFFVEKAYYEEISYDKEYKYYVYGEAYSNDLKKVNSYMYIVYLNTFDSAFYIEPYGQGDEESFSKKVKELSTNTGNELSEVTDSGNTKIKVNDYNTYKMKTETDLTKNVILNALKYYNFLQQNDVNRQYMLLEETYRSKRFGSAQNLDTNFQYANINLEYVRKSYDSNNNIIYIGIDSNDKYYIITEKSPTDFSIMLDSYTVPLAETTNKYSSAYNQQKACMCLEQVKEMLNNKDYKTIYNHLNSTYKNNNFETQAKFESYMKEKFYDINNFKYESYQVSNNSYIINVKVSDNTDETKNFTMNFVVKLADSIDKFEMSFEK